MSLIKHKNRGLRLAALALAVLLLAGMLSLLLPVPAAAAWNSSYNVQKAVEYARLYAWSKNTNYAFYENNDCANYVSQCLRAGGLQDVLYGTGWFYNSSYSFSGSWSNVVYMYAFFQEQGINIIRNPSISDIQTGDVIFYDHANSAGYADGIIDHVTIVTYCSGWASPLICSHTNSRSDAPYDYGYNGTTYWVAQVAPRAAQTTTYNAYTANTYSAPAAQTQTVTRPGVSYALDLNANIDGVFSPTLGRATADVYVDGVLVANDVSDFCQLVQVGASFEIRDVKSDAYTFLGSATGSLSGVQQGYTSFVLNFSTKSAGTGGYTAPASTYTAPAASTYTYSYTAAPASASTDWTVKFGTTQLAFWPQLYVTSDGRLMAPAAVLAAALGGAVVYNTAEVVDVWYGNRLIEFKTGSQTYTSGGESRSLRSMPASSSYALYVGVRDLAEAMGCTVNADSYSRVVTLSR